MFRWLSRQRGLRPHPLTITNAHVWQEPPSTGREPDVRALHVHDRILESPAPGARTINLEGYTIFPGLVNAHDHLELNHFPRSRFRPRYANAHDWGDEFDALLDTSPYRELRAFPLHDKLLIGAVKNLLSGATTVAHHNPPHPALFHAGYPTRVLSEYGWAHSLHFASEDEVSRAYRQTPPDVPFFIHLAEGTDSVAADEYRRLKAIGAAQRNTVVIHGVGLRPEDIRDAAPRIRGLVWCPSSNRFLLGQTADIHAWIAAGGLVALGSDSRLSADGDILDELRAGKAASGLDDETLVRMATANAARLLGLPDAGSLHPGARADFVAIRGAGHGAAALVRARRADLALVVAGGVPWIGEPALMERFSDVKTAHATLDGMPRLIHWGLASRLVQCRLGEHGLHIAENDLPTWPPSGLKKILGRGSL